MQTVMVRGRVYNYSHTIGRVGGDAGPYFAFAYDLARGEGKLLYVLSRGYDVQPSDRITMLTMDEEFIGDFGSTGEGDGQFIGPTGLALDSKGNVYVADEWLNRITIYDKDGNFLDKWGTAGSGEGELNGPAGLAIDREDNLYITENLNHRVQKFTKEGKFLLKWGQEGTGQGELNRPWGITIDGDGDVYVADWHNDRVEKFSPEGGYLGTFCTSGSGSGEVHLPSDVAVDKDGDVYVADWWNSKVEVYDGEGAPLTTFIGDAERLSKWAQATVDAGPDYLKARLRVKSLEPEWRFNRPTAIAIDTDGKILVTESHRSRIQVYQKEEGWVDPDYNL